LNDINVNAILSQFVDIETKSDSKCPSRVPYLHM